MFQSRRRAFDFWTPVEADVQETSGGGYLEEWQQGAKHVRRARYIGPLRTSQNRRRDAGTTYCSTAFTFDTYLTRTALHRYGNS
jgi:hypothetical protein